MGKTPESGSGGAEKAPKRPPTSNPDKAQPSRPNPYVSMKRSKEAAEADRRMHRRP